MLMMLPAIWWRSGLTKARPEVAPGCLLSLLASLYPLARGEAITEAEWAALHLQQGSSPGSRVEGWGLQQVSSATPEAPVRRPSSGSCTLS